MYLLKLYDECGLYDIQLFRSLENAKAKAAEVVRKVIDEFFVECDEPQAYGCESWEHFIQELVDEGEWDETFSIDPIEIQD